MRLKLNRKMIAGLASAVGVACTAAVSAKAADYIKRKWFAQGYDAGHFVGFMDGGITMAKKYNELGKKHSALAERYSKLYGDYEKLEREYSELCDEYYEE